MTNAPPITATETASVDDGLSTSLAYQSALAGLVSASGRFVPVPFVDDVIRQRCRKFVVSRALPSSQSDTQFDRLRPLYGDDHGWLAGCSGLLVRAPLKLLLFPIRKIIAITTSVRGVPLEVMRCVLLGRTVQRLAGSQTISREKAKYIRIAFDQTMRRMDFRALRAGLRDTLGGISRWKESSINIARRVAKSSQPMRDELDPDDPVQNGAREMTRVFQQPETLRLFDEFDRRFDENLKRLTAGK